MKLKLCLFTAISALTIFNASAAPKSDAGLHYVKNRGVVRCGVESENKIFAYKDAEGKWQGINAEICKMLSIAIFGRNDLYAMVPLSSNQVSAALTANKIDVMLGGLPYSANNEITSNASPAAVLYYDKQMFVAQNAKKVESMQGFKNARVCVVNDSDDMSKLQAFSYKYKLDFNILPFQNVVRAKEAFLLKRCELFTANSMILKDLIINSPAGTSGVEILPEVITDRPVYAFVDKANSTLSSVVKWVLNAQKLAEEQGLTSQNIEISLANPDISTRNVLGQDEKLWKKFGLQPKWLQTSLKEQGNYGEIFENTLGENSRFKIQRDKSNLLKNGGYITHDSFL